MSFVCFSCDLLISTQLSPHQHFSPQSKKLLQFATLTQFEHHFHFLLKPLWELTLTSPKHYCNTTQMHGTHIFSNSPRTNRHFRNTQSLEVCCSRYPFKVSYQLGANCLRPYKLRFKLQYNCSSPRPFKALRLFHRSVLFYSWIQKGSLEFQSILNYAKLCGQIQSYRDCCL